MEYQLIRKAQNKRTVLRYKNGQVIVSAPLYASKSDIDRFVNKNKEWIENQRAKDKETSLKDGDIICILDAEYILRIDSSFKRIGKFNNELLVRNQKDFEKVLILLAKPILTRFFVHIQKQLDLNHIKFKVGVYSSQWGSCNVKKGEIHLNAYLIMTDVDFINAVVLHEFAHIYVQNHSSQFYELVCTWMPNYKEVYNRYKKYRFIRIEEEND